MKIRPTLQFRVLPLEGVEETISFEPRRIYNAAYAGRNAEEVARHIADVLGPGANPNVPIPSLSVVSNHNLLSVGEIQEYNDTMIGEVEYVLVSHQGQILLGVGSDHCDFALESHDFTHSKNVAPDIVASDLWRLSDVEEYFDDLVLECKVRSNGVWQVVQQAPCSTLRSPGFWVGHPFFGGSLPEGAVIFSGTINHLSGMIRGDAYEVSISDPRTGRNIRHVYSCEAIAAPAALSVSRAPH